MTNVQGPGSQPSPEMALEKSILVRRKAQKLAREGRTSEAIEQLELLKSEAEVDPYDHVFIGDLLLRQGHQEEAIGALLEAVDSYRRVGLNRSAIAICKKILRLGSPPASVSRTLGDLYLSEELHTEAVQHLLGYLDGVPDDTSLPDEFFETLDKVSSLSGLQIEAALRLSDHFQRIRREDRAAELLERLAAQAGAVELAQDLREKAHRLSRQFLARQSAADRLDSEAAGDGPEGDSEAAHSGLNEAGEPSVCLPAIHDGSLWDEEHPSQVGPGLPAPTEDAETGDDLAFDFGLEDLTDPDTSPDDAGAQPPDELAELSADPRALDPGSFEVEHFPIAAGTDSTLSQWSFAEDPVDASDGTAVEPEEGALPCDEAEEPILDLDEGGAEELILDLDEDGESNRMLAEQAVRALESQDWTQARACYERLHLVDPLDREILESLLAVVRKMDDRAGEVRCLIQLGDAWIAEEEYEKALVVFAEVVRLDPENATGRRRLIRFREMGVRGADEVSEEGTPGGQLQGEAEPPANGPLKGVLESGSALVTVAPEPGISSEEWVDLGALLEEFKSGVQNQIDGDDFASHYDLAVSHRTMGLHLEAIEELDSLLGNEMLPEPMVWVCRELRGACMADLGRHAEAAEEIRRTLELPVDDEQKCWSLLYSLARILESAGEWREAEETYERLIAEAGSFLDAEQRRLDCRGRHGPDTMAA